MPFIASNYKPPLFFANQHIQTIFPANFRKIGSVKYTRERIITPDDDFLDLDWSFVNSSKLTIVLHGYEGHSYRDHILGMIKAFNKRGWDGVAMNQRGCSGEPNRKIRSYHAGSSDDLDVVINHILKMNKYKQIALVGFSLGGNIVLKYLGENEANLPSILRNAACISVPCDLKTTSIRVSQNPIYYKYFISKLYKKIRDKMTIMPDMVSTGEFKIIKNLVDYDNIYTAPYNGFKDADDYYNQCSCIYFLNRISIPVLILNAKDDPFLTTASFPIKEAQNSHILYLETPEHGGHTGFINFNKAKEYYSEQRVTEFIIGMFYEKLL